VAWGGGGSSRTHRWKSDSSVAIDLIEGGDVRFLAEIELREKNTSEQGGGGGQVQVNRILIAQFLITQGEKKGEENDPTSGGRKLGVVSFRVGGKGAKGKGEKMTRTESNIIN